MANSKCKKCRREGKKLFMRAERCNSGKCAIVKRNYAPGMHGNKGPAKLTAFGAQLREKQQAKRTYGIRERQFKNYFTQSIRKKGDTGNEMLSLLEMRLDNVVYRLGLAKSRREARQLVKHGFFILNEKKADIPSIQVRLNDVLKIKKSKLNKKVFENLEKKIDLGKLPSWMTYDVKTNEAKIVGKPTPGEIISQFDIKSVVEFYSR